MSPAVLLGLVLALFARYAGTHKDDREAIAQGLDADGRRGTRWSWTIAAEGAEERIARQLAAWRAEGRYVEVER